MFRLASTGLVATCELFRSICFWYSVGLKVCTVCRWSHRMIRQVSLLLLLSSQYRLGNKKFNNLTRYKYQRQTFGIMTTLKTTQVK